MSTAAKVLIDTTEDLKQWSTRVVAQRRALRASQAQVLGALAEVVADPEMEKRLEVAADRADEKRFAAEPAPVTAFGGL
jgi:pantoate kinase